MRLHCDCGGILEIRFNRMIQACIKALLVRGELNKGRNGNSEVSIRRQLRAVFEKG